MGEAYAADAVSLAKTLDVALNVWTVNEPDDVIRLAALGVNAIITDTPRIARRALGRA